MSRNRSRQGAVVVVMSTGSTDSSDATSCEASATAAAANTRFAADAGLLLESATTRQSAVSVCGSRGARRGAVDTSVFESNSGWVANSASYYDRVSTFYSDQHRSWYGSSTQLTMGEIVVRSIAIAAVLQRVGLLRRRPVEATLRWGLRIRSHVDHSVAEVYMDRTISQEAKHKEIGC